MEGELDNWQSEGIEPISRLRNYLMKQGLIKDGEVWLDMIKSRNLSSHTYNQATTDKIISAIREHYFASFNALSERLKLLAAQQYGNE